MNWRHLPGGIRITGVVLAVVLLAPALFRAQEAR